MIYLYSGLPGSGKSYHIAHDIWLSAKFGRGRSHYICNFPVNVPNVDVLPPRDFTVDDVLDIHARYAATHDVTREGQIKLVIDECGMLFNPRSWNDPKVRRMDWINFFSQHRKLNFDIILIAQDIGMLDKQIRPLIEIEAAHYMLNNFGLAGDLFSLLTLGHKVSHCTYRIASMRRSPKSSKIGGEFYLVHKGVFKIYDSHNLFGNELLRAGAGAPHGAAAPSGATRKHAEGGTKEIFQS